MAGCPDHTLDLSIARNIRLGGARQIQLRLDAFNALNTVVYNGRVTQLQLNSPTDQTVRNAQYLPDGQVDPNRLTPRNAGFGAVTGAQAMRSIQAQIRFSFLRLCCGAELKFRAANVRNEVPTLPTFAARDFSPAPQPGRSSSLSEEPS